MLLDHHSEITSMFVSYNLNVFASASIDGHVNLYTFPSNILFRSIKLQENLPANYVNDPYKAKLGIFICLSYSRSEYLLQRNEEILYLQY